MVNCRARIVASMNTSRHLDVGPSGARDQNYAYSTHGDGGSAPCPMKSMISPP